MTCCWQYLYIHKFCWLWTYVDCLCELIIDFFSFCSFGAMCMDNFWCCVTRVPNKHFSFLINRFSIWLCVKADVLLTMSMTNAKYLKASSISQHSSKEEKQSCKNEHSSWYDFYSYVILVFMKLWTQLIAFYIFCNMTYI